MTQVREPFIHIRAGPDCRVEGEPALQLGHVLPRGTGSPDGVFASWQWDGSTLTVRNDRHGFQPLFFFAGPGEVCVAPAAATLLTRGAPRDLDWDALAVFLRLGFFLGDDTPFRAIRAVPPNADFRWSAAGLAVQGRPPAWPAPRAIDAAAAARTYQELFAEAVRRRAPGGPFGVLLSGGRDSRHILFELCRQGCKPDLAATVDLPAQTDGPVAAAIARSLGLRHWRVPPSRPSLALEHRKNWETHFCADEHGWILRLRDALRGEVPVLYDGIGGDVLSGGAFLDPGTLALFQAGRWSELAQALMAAEHPVPAVPRLLNADAARQVSDERALARLTAELRRHADAPNPCGSFFFWNRTRREIALSPFSLFGAFRVYAPYLDHDVVDFLGSLPAEVLLDRALRDRTIAAAYPQWAHFPFAVRTRPPLRFAPLCLAWQVRRRLRRRGRTGLNRAYLLPRLLRAGLDPWYCRRSIDFLTIYPVYWAQLEDLAGGSG